MWPSLFKKKAYSFMDIGLKTDIHCHILPGVDDGSRNLKNSIAMLQALSDKGVGRIVLTPHVSSGLYPNRSDVLKLEFERLKAALPADLKGKINLYLAAEYMIDEDLEGQQELLCYPDKSILIEMSYSNRSVNLLDTVFRLVQDGYEPILAHPERYEFYFGGREPNNVAELEKLIDMGCRFQMNVMSLTGAYGPASINNLLYLLERGWYSFIATDAHSLNQLDLYNGFKIKDHHLEMIQKLAANNETLF